MLMQTMGELLNQQKEVEGKIIEEESKPNPNQQLIDSLNYNLAIINNNIHFYGVRVEDVWNEMDDKS